MPAQIVGYLLHFPPQEAPPLESCQTLHFRPVFAPLHLDSQAIAAIRATNPAWGVLAPMVFVRLFGGRALPGHGARRPNKTTITTEQEAGPDFGPEAGPEHEGRKRCSQSSRPAAGNTASF